VQNIDIKKLYNHHHPMIKDNNHHNHNESHDNITIYFELKNNDFGKTEYGTRTIAVEMDVNIKDPILNDKRRKLGVFIKNQHEKKKAKK